MSERTRELEREVEELRRKVELLENRVVATEGERGTSAAPFLGEFRPEMTKDEFCAIVARCKEAIRAGEVIQIVPPAPAL